MTEKSLFTELKRIGIGEEVAAHVQASLNGEHYATKNDLLTMQRLIYEQNEKMFGQNEKMVNGFANLKSEIGDVRTELKSEIADVRIEIAGVRTEIGGMHRQYWITFGGLITTIISVFAVNWYYHL